MSWPPQGFHSPAPSRFPCPYRFCSAIVYLRFEPPAPWVADVHGGGGSYWLVPVHDLSNALLKGTCPSSLMRLPYFRRDPWPEDTVRALEDAYLRDAKRMPSLIGQADRERERAIYWRTRPKPDSFSARGPGRMGREPGPDDIDDWQLGGREDEDSGKVRPPIVVPKLPPGVLGQEVGRHMASIPEVIGMIQLAAMKSGEAIAAIQEQQNNMDAIRASLDETYRIIAGVQGEMTSTLLMDYAGIIQQERNNLEQINVLYEGMRDNITVAQERGEEMIGRLLG